MVLTWNSHGVVPKNEVMTRPDAEQTGPMFGLTIDRGGRALLCVTESRMSSEKPCADKTGHEVDRKNTRHVGPPCLAIATGDG